MKIILASSSPRRRDLLNLIGIRPEVIVPSINETRYPGEILENFLERITIAKIKSVYEKRYCNSLVLSADTIVLLKNSVIGKPIDRKDAFAILRALSGNMHEVWTGISISYKKKFWFDYIHTKVYFEEISDQEINDYLNKEYYLDKAGAYAIQGRAAIFVKKIEGCFFNVMGFPLHLFAQMLKKVRISIDSIRSERNKPI